MSAWNANLKITLASCFRHFKVPLQDIAPSVISIYAKLAEAKLLIKREPVHPAGDPGL